MNTGPNRLSDDKIKNIEEDFKKFRGKVLSNQKEYQHLLEVLNEMIKRKDLIKQWHYLRDRYFPQKYGVPSTRFLISLLLNGPLQEFSKFINDKEMNELEFLYQSFGDDISRIALFLAHPYKLVGFEENFGDDPNSTMLTIHRADGENFNIHQTFDEKSVFSLSLLRLLTEEVKRKKIKVDVQLIKEYEEMLNIIKAEGNNESGTE
jgi:hypothetical protein